MDFECIVCFESNSSITNRDFGCDCVTYLCNQCYEMCNNRCPICRPINYEIEPITSTIDESNLNILRGLLLGYLNNVTDITVSENTYNISEVKNCSISETSNINTGKIKFRFEEDECNFSITFETTSFNHYYILQNTMGYFSTYHTIDCDENKYTINIYARRLFPDQVECELFYVSYSGSLSTY